MNIVAPVLIVQNLPVSRHEHGDRIRPKKHFGGKGAGKTIQARMFDAGIL